jgi:hypothetical protein
MKKLGRNDPCHCGSGKKFKKCCESKMIGGRYMATKINQNIGLSGLFNRQMSEISTTAKSHVFKPIRISQNTPAASLPEPAPIAPVVVEKIE